MNICVQGRAARPNHPDRPVLSHPVCGSHPAPRQYYDKTIIRGVAILGEVINESVKYYGPALQAASTNSHSEVVKLLLAQGADVNAQGGSYGTALQAASSGGHLEVVELLLAQGADVNTLGGSYRAALEAASEGGYLEVVKLLLAKGAVEPESKDDGT